MGLVIGLVVGLVLLALVVVWLALSSRSAPETPPARVAQPAPPPTRTPRPFDVGGETAQLQQEAEAAVPDLMRQVEADAAAMMPEIEAEAARLHAEMMHEAEAAAARLDAERTADEDDEPEPRRVIWREDYVPKDDEARYLTRDENGLPTVRLADAGDRLGIWSPLDGGALINPKGPGLRRRLGLCTSYARGSGHYRGAYRAADLTHGRWVELKREPDNPNDPNAVAMCAPGSRVPFGYVGRGRAASVARRIDAGEDMAGVTIWGPEPGSDDRSALVLIGSRADLAAMLA